MSKNFLKNRALAGIFIGVLISIISGLLNFSGIFNSIHNSFSNTLFTRQEPSNDIVIIAIDEKSTQPEPEGLGRYAYWSRAFYADLLENLQKENPAVITFDLLFRNENEFFPEGDELFADALKETDNVILAASLMNDGRSLKAKSEFSENTTMAHVIAPADENGLIRKVIPEIFFPQEGKYIGDLAVESVKKFLKTDELNLPVEQGAEMTMNFFAEPFSYQMIPLVDVVNGNFLQGAFTNKIILIGHTSSKEVHDEYFTPRDSDRYMPGIEFRANEIQMLLSEKFIADQSDASQFLTLAVMSIVLTILLNYLGILLSILVTFSALILYYFSARYFYFQGIILNMIYPFIAIILAYLASWVYKYFIADKNKREIKNAFSHYLSKDLVEEIARNPEVAKLGGEKRVVTVFFCDIKNSTTIAEKTQISAWVAQLNEYFTVMENVVKHYGGTIDKYEGDAIMGFWNAPVPQADHVERAYLAALEMKNMLKALNEKWAREGRPVLEFRIGINTGEAIVGNIGSKERFNYTAMGDTVNQASRLESSANKAYGTTVIVSGAGPIISAKFSLRELDTVYLPGKNEPVTLFELDATSEERKNLISNYLSALAAYRLKDFASAINSLQKISNDNASSVLLDRCKKLREGMEVKELDGNMVFRIVGK